VTTLAVECKAQKRAAVLMIRPMDRGGVEMPAREAWVVALVDYVACRYLSHFFPPVTTVLFERGSFISTRMLAGSGGIVTL